MTPSWRPGAAARSGLLASGWGNGVGVVIGAGVLAAVVFASIAYGSKTIDLATVADALVDYDPTNSEHLIIRTLRLPRTLVGVGVGAAPGPAGASLRGAHRNPLRDPWVFGAPAGPGRAHSPGDAVRGA